MGSTLCPPSLSQSPIPSLCLSQSPILSLCLSQSPSLPTMSLSMLCSLSCSRMFSLSMSQCVGTSGRRSLALSVSRQGEIYYTRKHEWVLVEGGKGTVGVSQYAADALGDVVYAQLPQPGDTLTAGEECGTLESVKAASELYSPVSGEVIENNVRVEDGPALVNQSPQGEGWLYRLILSKPEEVTELLNTEAYQELLKEERITEWS